MEGLGSQEMLQFCRASFDKGATKKKPHPELVEGRMTELQL
jgi:hypothetical protein